MYSTIDPLFIHVFIMTIVANIFRNYYAHDVFVMIGTNFLVQFDLRAIACFYFFDILEI
jgi:hypothetical protein